MKRFVLGQLQQFASRHGASLPRQFFPSSDEDEEDSPGAPTGPIVSAAFWSAVQAANNQQM